MAYPFTFILEEAHSTGISPIHTIPHYIATLHPLPIPILEDLTQDSNPLDPHSPCPLSQNLSLETLKKIFRTPPIARGPPPPPSACLPKCLASR